jgi:gliding motility-associated-like protein
MEAQTYIVLLSINKTAFQIEKPRALLLAFCFLFFFSAALGQVNLVPNPSFEIITYDTSLFVADLIDKAPPWDSLRQGGGGGNIIRSPDLILGGYQLARTGRLMAGLNYYWMTDAIPWRSYIQSPLIDTLVKNKVYCVTGYFNLMNRNQKAVDELSFYFDDGSVSAGCHGCLAPANPQVKSPAGIFYTDTLNWMKVQGTFTAIGNESYITIGNHKLQPLTFSISNPGGFGVGSQYYVDDVSVIEADLPAFAGRDTVICSGDSVFIGRPPEIGLECVWSSGLTKIGSGGGLWVKPVATQTFMVTQDVCGIIRTDTIQVQVKPKYTGPQVNLSISSATTCPANTVVLTATNNPPGTNTYNWLPSGAFTQTGNITATAFVSQNTTFSLSIKNNGQNSFCPFQRAASVSVSVPVYTDSPSILYNSIVCPQDTIDFTVQNAAPGNTVTYQWLPQAAFMNTSSLSAKSLVGQSTNYTISVTSSGNSSLCPFVRTLTASISVPDSCFKDPQIPNIFTPNNDDVNDVWMIKFPNGYTLQLLQVFNRWGTLIYERSNLNFNKQAFARIGWDGRNTSGEECSPGVYFYFVQFTDRTGTLKGNKGNVSLIK